MTKIIQDINLGRKLQELRKAKGLTQEDICAQLAVNGRPMLQSSDLIVLKRIFNVSFDEIFRDLEPVNKYDSEDGKQ